MFTDLILYRLSMKDILPLSIELLFVWAKKLMSLNSKDKTIFILILSEELNYICDSVCTSITKSL